LCTAQLQGKGTLAAHVVMTEQQDGRHEPCELRVEGMPSDAQQGAVLQWPSTHLGLGDEVRLRLLPDGPGQVAPLRVDGAAAPAPLPLNSDAQCVRLVELCNRFSTELFQWLDQTVRDEPKAHSVPLKVAVSNVAFVLAERLLYPAYLQRPQLIPNALHTDL
jgi:hypothetical protein